MLLRGSGGGCSFGSDEEERQRLAEENDRLRRQLQAYELELSQRSRKALQAGRRALSAYVLQATRLRGGILKHSSRGGGGGPMWLYQPMPEEMC